MKRSEWEFEYSSHQLIESANKQKVFRLSRVAWWSDAKEKVMAEVRESGLEVSESIANSSGSYSGYTTINVGGAPQLSVRADLQKKLGECHMKIQEHQRAADEYDGWIQVLSAHRESVFKLNHSDWLYFFGKV